MGIFVAATSSEKDRIYPVINKSIEVYKNIMIIDRKEKIYLLPQRIPTYRCFLNLNNFWLYGKHSSESIDINYDYAHEYINICKK